MFSLIRYWYDQKRTLRRQYRSLLYSRWERRNHPAFHRNRNRWSMTKTL